MDRIEPYWNWLLDKAREGIVKIPREIYDEITPRTSADITEKSGHSKKAKKNLYDWIRDPEVKELLILNEQIDGTALEKVNSKGYGENLDEKDFFNIGKDSLLIAYASKEANRIVVTKEISKPARKRGNRKIPDVCNSLDIECINDFAFHRQCDFRISS